MCGRAGKGRFARDYAAATADGETTVTIRLGTGVALTLAEVAILANGVDLVPGAKALGHVAEQSLAGAAPADNAIDGSGDTASYTSEAFATPAWWRLSVVAGSTVTSVRVTARTDCCTGSLDGAEIYVGERLCGTVAHARGATAYEISCAVPPPDFECVAVRANGAQCLGLDYEFDEWAESNAPQGSGWMARFGDAFDSYETIPSWETGQLACGARGKRLCSKEELCDSNGTPWLGFSGREALLVPTERVSTWVDLSQSGQCATSAYQARAIRKLICCGGQDADLECASGVCAAGNAACCSAGVRTVGAGECKVCAEDGGCEECVEPGQRVLASTGACSECAEGYYEATSSGAGGGDLRCELRGEAGALCKGGSGGEDDDDARCASGDCRGGVCCVAGVHWAATRCSDTSTEWSTGRQATSSSIFSITPPPPNHCRRRASSLLFVRRAHSQLSGVVWFDGHRPGMAIACEEGFDPEFPLTTACKLAGS